ncbi:MAG: NAD-dependent epimerase/dehydratase family protein [Acidimicrobiales bacterium]
MVFGSQLPHTPLTVLVTGGAGFIGAVVCEHLMAAGHRVITADRGTEPRHERARSRLAGAHHLVGDLGVASGGMGGGRPGVDLPGLLGSVDRVVHLAGRPGVQTSWGTGFRGHVDDNLVVTQGLLEAASEAGVDRVVVASSSSVYGQIATGRASEDVPLRPRSPYGVAKAGVEQLVGVYAGLGLSAVALRYFTAYGRGQRPDMAVARMIAATRGGPPFPVRAPGRQQRDLTHVDDVAAATVAALFADLPPGWVANVGSGRSVALGEILRRVAVATGRRVPTVAVPAAPGDPDRTAADISRAGRDLGWRPRVDLAAGLDDQVAAAGRDDQVPATAPRLGRTA